MRARELQVDATQGELEFSALPSRRVSSRPFVYIIRPPPPLPAQSHAEIRDYSPSSKEINNIHLFILFYLVRSTAVNL